MRFRQIWAPVAAAFLLLSTFPAEAQGPKPRLAAALEGSQRVALAGTRPAQATHGIDQGAMPADTQIKGITLVFNRSAAQQAELATLLTAQQDTASPLYHQWLTPDQFAARFGVAASDIASVQTWLQTQGFQVEGVSRSRDRITFNGTAGQVANAFGTELHRYAFADRVHFAPATDLSLPAALAPMVAAVLRLSDFHPHRQVKLASAVGRPAYTSGQTGNHFLTPSDMATMYDVSSTYKAGYNGAGQSIAIVAQSYITTAPITAFQTGAGLAANTPTLVLVPNTGVAAIDPVGDGDEGESQLDVEYASGMAPGANILVVYTGDNSNAGVFESLMYAVSENLAPIISGSYGQCEIDLQTSTGASQLKAAVDQTVQQASAQGQTVLFSDGDQGSTDCYGDTYVTAVQQQSLAVDFPASVPNVTAVGGTEMQAGTFASGNTQYWQSATGTDVVSSLLSYVPEAAWNEDALNPLSSGGGGASVLYPRPSWQAGVPGIPAGANRLLPDIALQASIQSPGFIYCTDDPADLARLNDSSSCSNGLRGPSGTFLTAGGTSFATPIFAGMLAVLNQVKHATGQGNINPTLYNLAANASTYASAFHDVTSGSNACTASATYCSAAGASLYPTTTGYDQATGLGSIDFAKLVAAWPSSAMTALAATTVVVQPASTVPAPGASDAISISVSPQAGAGKAAPTGTLQIAVDGKAVTPLLPLVNGAATYSYTAPAGVGSHAITAAYSGDSVYAASTGTGIVTVGQIAASGSFSLAAQALTVPYNGSQSTSFVITPAAGYTGTVLLSLTYPASAPTLCYSLSNPNSNGYNVPLITGGPVTGTLTIGEGTACTASPTGHMVLKTGGGVASIRDARPGLPSRRWPEGIGLAGLLCAGFAVRRPRRLPALLSVTLLAGLAVGLSGCGSNSGAATLPTPTPVAAQPQTLTVTLTGADTVSTGITNSTTLALTLK